MKSKKRDLFLAVFPILMLTGVTFSYLTGYDQQKNVFGVGKNPVQITEDFPDPEPTPGPDGTERYKKVVTITNGLDGPGGFNVDCYIRARISYNNQDIGKAVTLLGQDLVNWYYNSSDGYYYYKHLVKEKESTTPLMTGFEIDPDRIDRTYEEQIREFEINVYTESVGSGAGDSFASAWQNYLGNRGGEK